MRLINLFKKYDSREEENKEVEFDNYVSKEYDFTFNKYKEIKKEVINSLEELINIYNDYGLESERLSELKEKIKLDNFQIVVLGEFSRGKSTFINALLNKNILPSNILPTTAVITKIFYSDEPKVKINFNDNTSEIIDITDLRRYITSLENEEISNRIVDAEVYYPTQFCLDGCNIVDTPGVNDINQQKVDITYNYIPKSDAAIMLLDPDQPFTESERNFIENKIIDNRINKIFFVLNKIDQVKDHERQEIVKHVNERILSLKNINEIDIKLYCLSSKEALKARLKNEDNAYNRSFREFESDLMEFLANEKGKYLLSSVIVKILTEMKKIEDILHLYLDNLQISLNELETKKEKFDVLKEKAIEEYNEVKFELDKQYNKLLEKVEFEINIKFDEVFNLIYQMIDSMEININNYTEAIPNVIESQMKDFVNNTLYPYVRDILDNLKNQLYRTLYNVKYELKKFKNETLEEVNSTSIMVSENVNNQSSRDNIYEPNNQVILAISNSSPKDFYSTITFAGGAIGAGLLVANMITGIIGIILGALAGGVIFKTLDNSKQQRDKNFVFSRLNEIKETVISRSKEKIKKVIEEEYNRIEQEIYSEIDDNLNNYEELLNNLINEKMDKTKEINEESERIKSILLKINKIKGKLNTLLYICGGENYGYKGDN